MRVRRARTYPAVPDRLFVRFQVGGVQRYRGPPHVSATQECEEETEGDARPLSLPARRMLRNTTQYHERSSSAGSSSSAQLNASGYGWSAYDASRGRNLCSARCSASDAGSIDGRRESVMRAPLPAGTGAYAAGSAERSGGR